MDASCHGLTHSPRLGGLLLGNPVLRLDSPRNSSFTLSRTRLLREVLSGGRCRSRRQTRGVIAVACEMIRLGGDQSNREVLMVT